jgi:hypothetical protein
MIRDMLVTKPNKPTQQMPKLKRDTMHRRTRRFPAKLAFASVLVCAGLTIPAATRAEPVTNLVLSGYQIATDRSCTIFKVNFNFRIRYVSHFPATHGTELRIMLRPIDPRRFQADGGTLREALRPPQDRSTSIKAIQYEEHIADGPTLTFVFDRPVNFDAAGGADFQSLIVSLSHLKNGKACQPVFPGRVSNGWDTAGSWGETVVARRQPARETTVAKNSSSAELIPDVPPTKVTGPAVIGPAVIGPSEVSTIPVTGGSNANGGEQQTAVLIAEARAALQKGNFQAGIAQLKKAVQQPENRRTPEARELLGVAYQKDRQIAAAKSVYEDYLHRYPNGEGSEGVRQRLLAIETAGAAPAERLRATTIGPTSVDGAPPPAGPQSGKSYATVSGSISSFFISDDSHSVNRDATQALNLNATKDDHQVHQNTLMSSVDLSAAWGDGDVKNRFRFSGTELNNFSGNRGDSFGIAALYLDTAVKDWDSTFRLGRQTRNTGGILGRFDGAVYTYQYDPLFGASVYGGSPVELRTDSPFKNDRYFYGGSLNFTPVKGFEASVYGIEQKDRSIIDRQAVGAELRYNDLTKSAFLTVDYDTRFEELDAAIFTGMWTLPDKSVIRAGADYRMAPYLTMWNALQGQPFTTLYDLLKIYNQSQVQQMAVDRTATYQSANVGYTRPLTDKLQLNLDFTQAHIKGTITSYNVTGTPDAGDEFYYAAQLVGTSLLTDGDLYTAAIRYSDLKDSNNFALDFSTRYPLIEDLRIAPRIIGTYSNGKTSNWNEYTVIPSFLIDYSLRNDLKLEIEIGERFTWRTQGASRTNENELLITAGVRYDFNTDLQKCLTPSVFCRDTSRKPE